MAHLPNTSEQSNQSQPISERSQESKPVKEAEDIWSGRNGWLGGVVLIVLGAIFLLQNFELFDLDNWWALFILIPAVGAFAKAWRTQQHGGRWSSTARGEIISGLILALVALAFLFNLDFGLLWPVFLILGGVSLLVNALLPA